MSEMEEHNNLEYLPSFSSSFISRSRAILRSSGRASSCRRIAEFSKACSCSGLYSSALSKYASACAGLFNSKNTTPSCFEAMREKNVKCMEIKIIMENRKSFLFPPS